MVSKLKRLRDNKHILYVIKNAKPNFRKRIIKAAEPEVIKTLCEIVVNTLNGNHRLCPKTKKALIPYKSAMRKIVQFKKSVPGQRKVLIQRGGFLPALLGSLLSGVIGTLIEKYAK